MTKTNAADTFVALCDVFEGTKNLSKKLLEVHNKSRAFTQSLPLGTRVNAYLVAIRGDSIEAHRRVAHTLLDGHTRILMDKLEAYEIADALIGNVTTLGKYLGISHGDLERFSKGCFEVVDMARTSDVMFHDLLRPIIEPNVELCAPQQVH